MGQEEEKKIIIRVNLETWRRFDDKRHAERTSFQKLGLYLFQHWFDGNLSVKNSDKDNEKHGNVNNSVLDIKDSYTEADRPWVEALIRILQSKNEVAALALKSNLLAFSDYANVAPEVEGGFSEIGALERGLAALEQQLVDARKKAAVGSSTGTSKAGRKVAK